MLNNSPSPDQRYTFVENTIAHTYEALKIPAVRRYLGSLAEELSYILDSSVSAEVDAEGVVGNGAANKDKLQIAALGMGERAIRSSQSGGLNAKQIESLTIQFGKQKADNINIEFGQKLLEQKPLHVLENELGYVHSGYTPLPGNKVLHDQPMMILNYDASFLPHADSPLFLHEATHALQLIRRPLVEYTQGFSVHHDAISRELEAYHVTAMVILGIQQSGREKQLLSSIPFGKIHKALKIEGIRKRNAEESAPFAATPKVAAAMVKNGLGFTSFLKDTIARNEK